mmetsp:Transcript_118012/g.306390  ORF Transcript_118012/g.306390 Transcript_118012/m.306390 type:complete len:200 (+) Transcript_118012:280-879(+)
MPSKRPRCSGVGGRVSGRRRRGSSGTCARRCVSRTLGRTSARTRPSLRSGVQPQHPAITPGARPGRGRTPSAAMSSARTSPISAPPPRGAATFPRPRPPTRTLLPPPRLHHPRPRRRRLRCRRPRRRCRRRRPASPTGAAASGLRSRPHRRRIVLKPCRQHSTWQLVMPPLPWQLQGRCRSCRRHRGPRRRPERQACQR